MPTWKSLTPAEKVSRAKVRIQRNFPFYNRILLHLDPVETEEVPTAAVDFRGNLYYNPEFIDHLDEDEARGVILHEALHLVLKGRARRGGRKNHRLWNLAQDAIINHVVVQESNQNSELDINLPTTIPAGDGGEQEGSPIMPDSDGSLEVGGEKVADDLDDETFESMYDILKREVDESKIKVVVMDEHFEEDGDGQQQSGQGDGEAQQQGEGGGQGDEDEDGGDDEQQQGEGGQGDDEQTVVVKGKGGKEIEIDVSDKDIKESIDEDPEEILEKAAQDAQENSQGHIPAGMEQRIDNIRQGEKNWRKVLANVVGSQIETDFTWASPHKKSHSMGAYLPDTEGEKVEVTVALDTSGSVSDENLREFMGEVIEIINTYDRVDLTVIQHDADVHDVESWDSVTKHDVLGDEGFIIQGRGGTNHVPVFERIEEDYEIDSDVIICFTDGYTTAPNNMPRGVSRVVWAINNYDVDMGRLNIGEIIRVHAEN